MSLGRWLPAGEPPPKSTAPWLVFCLPYAGAGASAYRGWAAAAPAGMAICPVQLPGREQRLRETPLRRVDALVEAIDVALRPCLDRPFVIFGHSMGALLAYEWARRLSAQPDGPRPAHLCVSGRSAPHLAWLRPPVHALPDSEFLVELRRLRGTPDSVLAHTELMHLLLPTLRADFECVETYRWHEGPPLPMPLTVCGGMDDDVTEADLNAWRTLSLAETTVHRFVGDHFFLHQHRDDLIRMLWHACNYGYSPVAKSVV